MEKRLTHDLTNLKEVRQYITGYSEYILLDDSLIMMGNPNHEKLKSVVHHIPHLPHFDIAYGAATTYVYPFVTQHKTPDQPITAASIINSLSVQGFISEHIKDLNCSSISFPGYHPRTLNDEIHNDFSEQNIFDAEDYDDRPISPDQGIHGELMNNVLDNKLWYLLLHPWKKATTKQIEIYERNRGQGYTHLFKDEEYRIIYGNDEYDYFIKEDMYVLLFAIGLTPDARHIIGYASHQVCHNLCD